MAEKEQRIYRFAAQLLAWQWHYRESVRKRSRYLELLALQKIVLFTCRIVLAANEMFFPFHKWMLRVTATATHFYGMDAEAMGPIWPTWFLKDTELAWLSGYPSIDDL